MQTKFVNPRRGQPDFELAEWVQLMEEQFAGEQDEAMEIPAAIWQEMVALANLVIAPAPIAASSDSSDGAQVADK